MRHSLRHAVRRATSLKEGGKAAILHLTVNNNLPQEQKTAARDGRRFYTQLLFAFENEDGNNAATY